MKEILEFCGKNWSLIVVVVSAVAEIIILFLRTKKDKKLLICSVFDALPGFISEAEELKCSGEEKLQFVLVHALDLLESLTGQTRVRLSRAFGSLIIEEVEKILSTPQKKGI